MLAHELIQAAHVLVALPFLLDDLYASMRFVLARAERERVQVRWPLLWRAVDPFAGL